MKKLSNIVLILALIVGVLSSAVSLRGRVSCEDSSRDVTVIMSLQDVAYIAKNSGKTSEDICTDFESAGINIAEREENLFFLTEETSREEVNTAVRNNLIPVLIENDRQTGADISPEAKAALKDLQAGCLKCFRLSEKYAGRYNYLGDTGTDEIEDILFRAVTDRNIRVIWLTLYKNEGKTVTDSEEYVHTVENLRRRLEVQSITVSGMSKPAAWYEPSVIQQLGVAVGVIAGGILLLRTIIRRGNLWQIVILVIVSAVVAVCLFADKYILLMTKALALGAAVFMPCLGVAVFALEFRRNLTCTASLLQTLGSFVFNLVSAAGCSLMGSVFIGAILGSSEYMLELEMFSGVKVSQVVPLIYSVYIIWLAVYHVKGRSLGGDIKSIIVNFKNKGKVKIVLIAVLIAACAVIFILRTGDGMLAVTKTELKFRSLLERSLYVRPRTKEMLIAWPCAAGAIVCARNKWKNAVLPLGILAAVGLASICNTFCHIRADFFLSLTRTFLALAIGVVLGAVVICVIYLIGNQIEKRNKNEHSPSCR